MEREELAMSVAIDTRDLPRRLDEALARTAAGDEVLILDGATPRARMVPVAPLAQPRERIPGLHPGAMQPAVDFDSPLPDEFWLGQP
jgi:antitoxin (DNA-binding transcriptional repressor) of toxin-antitoxin stability system